MPIATAGSTVFTAATYYEGHADLKNARLILRKATAVPYRTVDDLAAVWIAWAEMELRHKHYAAAREALREATAVPPSARRGVPVDEAAPVQARLHRHTKLWAFYCDLQESLGTFDEAKATYEAMLSLKIVTPQLVLNFGAFLEERKHFEDAFQAYERGVALFKFPHVLPIWSVYLHKFVARYGRAKLERARDLFEQALDGCPPADAAPLFLLYAKLEEEHGLVRNAMAVYQRAVDTVSVEGRLEMYNMYIARAAEFFGVTKTRDIYEAAINALPSKLVPPMCERYANLERKLGEIDRARAIYVHGAQQVDPASEGDTFWTTWHDFEVAHGNEDTFREMLRIKRAVRAVYMQAAITQPRPGDKRARDDAAAQPAQPPEAAGGMAALEAAQQQEHQQQQQGEAAAGEAEAGRRRRRLRAGTGRTRTPSASHPPRRLRARAPGSSSRGATLAWGTTEMARPARRRRPRRRSRRRRSTLTTTTTTTTTASNRSRCRRQCSAPPASAAAAAGIWERWSDSSAPRALSD